MEFPGVLKKKQVHFPGVNEKQCEISRDDQENIMWNFIRVFVLDLKISDECNTYLWCS